MPFQQCFLCWLTATSLLIATASGQPSQPSGDAQIPADQKEAQPSERPADTPTTLPLGTAFLKDEWTLWTSPLRKSTYSSPTVKRYGIPFGLLSAALIATDTKTADLLPNTSVQTTWSGRVSQIGAAYTLAGFSAGTFLIGKAAGNRHAEETGWLALHAIAHTQIVVFVLKQMTNRERPLTHEGGGGFWAGGDSFPSGHSATSFAVATIFALEYRNHIAVPITAYAIATAVAASRLGAQRHWVSDIFVGSATGFLIGRYVYKRHHDPNLPGSPVKRTDSLMPQVSLGLRGVSLNWHF